MAFFIKFTTFNKLLQTICLGNKTFLIKLDLR